MKLTEDQQKQVADLEKETKAKLYKILTPEQQKTLETAARRVRDKVVGADMAAVRRVSPGGPAGGGNMAATRMVLAGISPPASTP